MEIKNIKYICDCCGKEIQFENDMVIINIDLKGSKEFNKKLIFHLCYNINTQCLIKFLNHLGFVDEGKLTISEIIDKYHKGK